MYNISTWKQGNLEFSGTSVLSTVEKTKDVETRTPFVKRWDVYSN